MEAVEPPAPRFIDAGEVLRPALMLWLVTELAFGVQGHVWAFLWTPQTSELGFLVSYELGYLVICAIVLRFVWRDRQARRIFARPRPRMVELCLLVGVVSALVLSMWERQIPAAWSPPSSTSLERSAGWPILASLLSTAVLPAVFEELMYRGLLLQRFVQVMPAKLAIAVQAMLFATMHRDPVMLLPHFVFGVVAGFLRTAAGGLWPCVLMHLLWNAHVVLLTYGVL